MRIENFQNENRKFIKNVGNFHVLEYSQDASVSPMNAMNEYFMSKMNVRRRQVVIDIDSNHSAIIQAGAMQWMAGKPEYVGNGIIALEPTYKYIILEDVSCMRFQCKQ